MRRFGVVAVCLFVACIASPPVAASAVPRPADESRVVVQFASKVIQSQTLEGHPPSLHDQGYRTLKVPAGKTRQQFIAELRRDPDVLSAEDDVPVYAAATPNDPFYAGNQAAYLAAIHAPEGWETTTGSHTVVVAVLDSGTDLSHPEFSGRLWENPRETVANGLDDDNNGCVDDRYGCRIIDLTQARAAGCGYTSSARTGAVSDDHGRPGSLIHSHGTMVAGVIGAAGNNGQGVSGVAWDIRIMTVKVLDCGPFGQAPRADMSSIAEAIDYARIMGANVISLSLASDPSDPRADIAPLRQAIANAQAAGVVIVAAAGNHAEGSRDVGPGYPAAYTQFPNLVAVGGSDNSGHWADFSNYGPAVGLAAPSIGITSTVRTDIGFERPFGMAPNGTSFATPLVAGMFALMASRNPYLTAEEYVRIAKETASPPEPAPHGQNWAGAGIINIGAALAHVPMTINGTALRDWKDVPNGTDVRATIDGADCGSSTVQSFGPIARYTVRVKTDAEQAGCGAFGRTVTFVIAGSPAQPVYPWGGPNEVIGYANQDISIVSPPPGPIVVQALNGDWSNIAHLDPGGPLPNAFDGFSSPWTALLRWAPDKPFLEQPGAYQHFAKGAPGYVNDFAAVERYDAIWVNAAQATVASPNPNPAPGRTVELKEGWNNFVYTGTAKAVSEALAPVAGKYEQVLQYDNTRRAWLSYLPGRPRYLNDFGGLFKLKVYWVYMTAPATLVMN